MTFGEVDAGKLPIGDLEYLFLQVRGKSVGETVDMKLSCATEGCGGEIDVKVEIADISISTDDLPDPKLQLSETLGVVMKYPNASVQSELEQNPQDSFMTIIKNSIDQIFDEDDVYDLIDYSPREVDTFIESLTVQQLEMLSNWVESMPTLEHTVDYTCKGFREFFLIALSHESVYNYYNTNFQLMQHHKYSLTELENMMPWEREVYMKLLLQHLETERERLKNRK